MSGLINRFEGEGGIPGFPMERQHRLSPEEESAWEEKERKAREEIQKRFITIVVDMKRDCDIINDIVNSAESKVVGANHERVDLSEDDLSDLTVNIKDMNFLLGKARPMLDSYIRFSTTTPDFKPINNLMYQLNTFLRDTQKKRFYQIHKQKYDKRYFKKIPLLSIVDKISFLVERILGTMSVGGDYIVDVGKSRRDKYGARGEMGPGTGMDRFGGSYWKLNGKVMEEKELVR